MKALLLVDLQNDFMPGGALGVPQGDQIIPTINKLMALDFDLIVASQDWHPPGHASFAATHAKDIGDHINLNGVDQILWPTHCVQNTHGSDFVTNLDKGHIDLIVHKGTEKNIDSYSTFFDNKHLRPTGLEQMLRERGVTDVYIAGLATDYCVKFSALDAIQLGFHTYVITDACRGVNLKEDDYKKAFEDMRKAGILFIDSQTLLEGFEKDAHN